LAIVKNFTLGGGSLEALDEKPSVKEALAHGGQVCRGADFRGVRIAHSFSDGNHSSSWFNWKY
jgi:hypothetical protein